MVGHYALAVDRYIAANRVNWDDRVPIHVASRFYDVEGFVATPRGPRDWEQPALGPVEGLDVVHLQCHFGLDTLALAHAGAHIVGVDFSRAAIATATQLAERTGLGDRARFVEADVRDAARVLAPATFDLVYVTLGSLCWLPSIEQWAQQVAALLRSGGRLYLHDVHPLAWALADHDLSIEHTYFEDPEPVAHDDTSTYTDSDKPIAHTRIYEWNHSIGEIITAAIDNGLRVDSLHEHDWTTFQQFAWLEPASDGRHHIPTGRPRVPLTFTLTATNTGHTAR